MLLYEFEILQYIEHKAEVEVRYRCHFIAAYAFGELTDFAGARHSLSAFQLLRSRACAPPCIYMSPSIFGHLWPWPRFCVNSRALQLLRLLDRLPFIADDVRTPVLAQNVLCLLMVSPGVKQQPCFHRIVSWRACHAAGASLCALCM